MSDPLYRRDLLRLAADAHGAGRLADADATGHAFNPACGDQVAVDVSIHAGRITNIALDTKACALAQASASVLGAALRGVDRARVIELRAQVAAMLAGGQPPPRPFEAYGAFQGAIAYDSRHRCVLLPIDAVLDALRGSVASDETST
ncbi:MAG TPA: iron-sulfur cluster assembly scaffold protein [Rhizomicrobium sp.]|jgi:NifU-like protein involved in Fe-S cluster formation|nr:iron-sulfur cluster assembly scaffold protein [Rhizomicrobium sp.]